MIELRTGVNGAGKTLYLVDELARLFKRWEKHPEESRPVYVYNVRELVFPVLQIPHRVANLKGIEYIVPLWDEMPEGSLVVIDECQKVFPVRSSQSAPPEHILWFTEHRRLGFDFILLTQNPKFTDPTIRALVGRHMHFRRLFGGNRSMIYEWDACNDSLSGFKNAVKTYFPFPKESFKYYKSAEIHTKQKFRLPFWFVLPLIALVLGVISFPRAYSVIRGRLHEQPVVVDVPKVVPAGGAAVGLSSASAVPPGLFVASKGSAQAPSAISACLATATRCKCYDLHGVEIHMVESECRDSADHPTARFRFEDAEGTRPVLHQREAFL